MLLLTDKYSCFKSKLYGKAGDEISIIAEHGNVLIVEGKNGKRFSVCRENIGDKNAAPAMAALITKVPIANRAAPIKQGEMF